MFSDLWSKLFDPLKRFRREVDLINSLEEKVGGLADEDLKAETFKLKERVGKGESLDDVLPEAFALVRETARRHLGQRHFDEQLLGGIVLHRGIIAEMMTGEGKTLTSTAPIYLNALTGGGVHLVTVNEYLAKRDAVWMGQIYHALGLSTACLIHQGALIYDPDYKMSEEEKEKMDKERDKTGSFLIYEDFLRPISRQEAYQADITYGTNHEFGFDYLRDNLAQKKDLQTQRPLAYAIVDEIDSILIDEARTPLIISAPDAQSSEFYKRFSSVVSRLSDEEDYVVDEKLKTVSINDNGIEKVEKMLGISNIYEAENLRLVHYLEESLRAKALFLKDRDYVVKDGEIVIVDQFTGRLMHGRRYSGGLHQAIEAKEGVKVQEESKTYAKISIQNYFKMYKKLAGMTGTAKTSAEEFTHVYNLEVVSIPPHKPVIRRDVSDAVYKNFDIKMRAVARRVKEAQDKGQPVLIGTTSIEKNEIVSRYLAQEGIVHEILNAKNHQKEGQVIAQAGQPGVVTVATNMAGRGVDIVLGGNPPSEEGARKVKEAGGLLVIGTERHEARRIDNQLRGRSGRQGDPGESQFYLSLDDDLMRVFGGDRIKNLMERFDLPEDEPIEMKMVSRAVKSAQEKVEGFHFDARKHLLDYDDVLNRQRNSVYKYRQEILEVEEGEKVKKLLDDILLAHSRKIVDIMLEAARMAPAHREEETKDKDLVPLLINTGVIEEGEGAEIKRMKEENSIFEFPEKLGAYLEKIIPLKTKKIINDPLLRLRLLSILDMLWMNHLENMDSLQESVRLRAYGQKDPLVEFRREAIVLFDSLFDNFRSWVFENIFRLSKAGGEPVNRQQAEIVNLGGGEVKSEVKYKGTGRNDPCPCGSGKKFKKCHGS